MVGLHIRNVFDAPRDQESNVSAEGRSAMEGASKEYGGDAALKLLHTLEASEHSSLCLSSVILSSSASGIHAGNSEFKSFCWY